MARKNKQDSPDTLVIDLTKIETPGTCKNCKHWKTEQSIFDFSERTGICLVPDDDLLGFKTPNIKEFITEGKDKGKASFQGFANEPTSRGMYFITRKNFGCIKFEQKQS